MVGGGEGGGELQPKLLRLQPTAMPVRHSIADSGDGSGLAAGSEGGLGIFANGVQNGTGGVNVVGEEGSRESGVCQARAFTQNQWSSSGQIPLFPSHLNTFRTF
jgi:hypothetical protein